MVTGVVIPHVAVVIVPKGFEIPGWALYPISSSEDPEPPQEIMPIDKSRIAVTTKFFMNRKSCTNIEIQITRTIWKCQPWCQF
jgi:hypothetical protein